MENIIQTLLKEKKELYKFIENEKDGAKAKLMKERLLAIKYAKKLNIVKLAGVNYYKDLSTGKWTIFNLVEEVVKHLISNDNDFDVEFKKQLSLFLNAWITDKFVINWKADERVFWFKNGYVEMPNDDQEEPKFTKIDGSIYEEIPIPYIPYNYVEEPQVGEETNLMKQLLTWLSKGNERELLNILTMLGITMGNIRVEHFFYLYGEEGSGKSSLLDLVKQLVGTQHAVNSDLNEINTRFGKIPLIGKKLLYNDDISKGQVEPSTLKQLTSTGATFTIELKGVNTPLQIQLPLNIVFNSNDRVNFESMKGVGRRIIIFSFPYNRERKDLEFKSLDKKDFFKIKPQVGNDYLFTDKAIESIIPLIVKATQMFLNNYKTWRKSSIEFKEFENLNEANDNVLSFINEFNIRGLTLEPNGLNSKNFVEGDKLILMTVNDWYETHYVSYCENSGLKKKSKLNFKNDLITLFNKQGLRMKETIRKGKRWLAFTKRDFEEYVKKGAGEDNE